MNQLLEPETPAPEHQRGPRFWHDEEKQSIIVGAILTFILWWPLLLAFGWGIVHIHGKYDVKFAGPKHARQFNIEIARQELKQPPKPPPPNRFVETNPDAPANIPDKANNFAARNQQAAQEKPTPNGRNDLAATKGRKDIESTHIVDGDLSKEKTIPPAPALSPSTATQAAPRREQNPLTGFEKNEGDNKEAFGTNVAKLAENTQNVPQKVEGVKDAPLIENANANTPQIDPKHPMPRPQLDHTVRPAIFSDNPNGTSNVGLVANSAFKTNYGEYLDKLLDTVQLQWYQLLQDASTYPPGGTHEVIKFRLNSEGRVVSFSKAEGDAGDIGEKYCTSAISIPSTGGNGYGKWSDDMVALLGTEQELTIVFYYNY